MSKPSLLRRDRTYGRAWIDRVLDGTIRIYRSTQTLAIRPNRYKFPITDVVVFNYHGGTIRLAVGFFFKKSTVRQALTLGAGEAYALSRVDVARETPWLLEKCRKVSIVVANERDCITTHFATYDQVHVFFMDSSDRSKNRLETIVTRYAHAEFQYLQGRYKPFVDPAFPDLDNLQEIIYHHVRANYSKSMRRFFASDFALAEHLRIPQVIHWLWLKDKNTAIRLGEKNIKMMHSWARHNPGFMINLWTDMGSLDAVFCGRKEGRLFRKLFGDRVRVRNACDIASLFENSKLPNAAVLYDVFQNITSAAARSDVLRLLILHSAGGIYCDVNDTECLTSIAEYCNRFSFFIGVDAFNRAHNAVIAGAPKHPIVEAILLSLKTGSDAWNRRLSGSKTLPDYFFVVLQICGPYLISKKICELVEKNDVGEDVLILPFRFFHNPQPRQAIPLAVVTHHSNMSWAKSMVIRFNKWEGVKIAIRDGFLRCLPFLDLP